MTHKEEKIPNYINFPYDIFLMLRLEFLALCQDELEAKIMRIIEKAVNDEWERTYRERCATTPKNEPVEMPDDVWVAIPNRYFLDRLLGTVQSETTLKAAMKSLTQKKCFIFRRDRSGRYEAPEYTLNKEALIQFFATLPADPRQLDMKAIMKQERKKHIKEEDQLLPPSIIDPIATDRVKNWPHQTLPLSPPIIAPMDVLGEGQLLPPTNITNISHLDTFVASSDDERNERFFEAPSLEDDVSPPKQDNRITQESLLTIELPDASCSQQSAEEPPVDKNQGNRGKKQGSGENNRASGGKTEKPTQSKEELTPQQKERARALRGKIVERCGKLPNGEETIGENKAIAKLVKNYSDHDIDDTHHYLIHCHFKWSKPDFKFHIRGYVILREIESVLRIFADDSSLREATEPPSQKPATPPSNPVASRYKKLPPPPASFMAAASGGTR